MFVSATGGIITILVIVIVVLLVLALVGRSRL